MIEAQFLARLTLVGLTAGASLVVGSATGGAATPPAGNQWPTRVVAAATTASGSTIWSVKANGAVQVSEREKYHGSARPQHLAQPIVGIAGTATGDGYWLVAGDGGVFSYGDARFYGSMGGTHLNQPIVGIASTKNGRGYWLVAADGGIFTFGNARFLGSLGALDLDQPIVGISATRSGRGYRLIARDGGVFTFGDATYRGSLGGRGLTDVVGMAQTPSGNGYWILRQFGQTYCSNPSFGCAVDLSGPVPDWTPGTYVSGPSVDNVGDAQALHPSFLDGFGGGRPFWNPNFSSNPAVAIVGNPAGQGFLILRAKSGTIGFAGVPFPR